MKEIFLREEEYLRTMDNLEKVIPKKELLERRVSPMLEEMMQQRKSYQLTPGEQHKLTPVEGVERSALAQAPIMASGDVYGSVMFLCDETTTALEDTELKLIQTAAAFLGKQMEE